MDLFFNLFAVWGSCIEVLNCYEHSQHFSIVRNKSEKKQLHSSKDLVLCYSLRDIVCMCLLYSRSCSVVIRVWQGVWVTMAICNSAHRMCVPAVHFESHVRPNLRLYQRKGAMWPWLPVWLSTPRRPSCESPCQCSLVKQLKPVDMLLGQWRFQRVQVSTWAVTPKQTHGLCKYQPTSILHLCLGAHKVHGMILFSKHRTICFF